ncbi:hypothetical protein DOK78_002975 [Enterococcus sp. DIV2402]|uniref:DUF1659 domain-containing protein n=1 Tax=Candidatus Enterococcus lowellii TaxID=2230877 RepID=A0ABZ2SRW8_9ENTE|nr:hypothetical protein [Enterococcus sp. DIV2402]MBO0465362.1 hypothetical protein [Enterococcus sp. DIV2402]
MKTHSQTKLTVQFTQEGEDKTLKQNFANVIADPTEAQVLALGDVVASLAPDTVTLDTVIETVEYEYNK